MKKSTDNKRSKKGYFAIYFLAVTVITIAAVAIAIKEVKRVKDENELLSYEVW